MKKYIPHFFLGLLIFTVFRAWFMPGLITSGDFWFNFPSMYHQFDMFAYAWNWIKGSGLGTFSPLYQATSLDFGLPIFILGKLMGLRWEVVERVGFFYPFIILSIFSSRYAFKKILNNNPFWILSVIIFVFNTYALTIVSGGQIVIAIAYSITPLVLISFMNLFADYGNSATFKKSMFAGLLFAAQIILDLRIAYVSAFGIFLYFILHLDFEGEKVKGNIRKIFFGLVVPFALAFLLNAFWILPVLTVQKNPFAQLGAAFNSIEALKFYSFAKFENTISLLHPNWPENIFGKSYFMRPEFLLIPILAFSSLLFIQKEKVNKNIVFFVALAIVGAFFAKGSNEPFGGIYIWMFEHVPGFVMFRDSTKFYSLIAFSFSILIPFTVYNIYTSLKQSKLSNLNLYKFVFPGVLVYLLFLVKPAFLGELGGAFKSTYVPWEYVKLERYLSGQPNFYRTLWIPDVQRFGYYSNYHPYISAKDLFESSSTIKLAEYLKKDDTKKLIQEASIKYIIVPYDSEKEIFLTNREYDSGKYSRTIAEIEKVKWFRQIPGFGRIAVFEISGFKDHFSSDNPHAGIHYKYINPATYTLNVSNSKEGDRLIFSENFDSNWIAKNSHFTLSSSKFENRFNSFVLPVSGSYSFELYYKPQEFVNIGLFISLILFFGVMVLLLKLK